MPRFLASWTTNFTWSMCSGVRYIGTPFPGDILNTKMPLAASRSRSWTILAILSLASPPFQLRNGWMAPYSRGGVLKLAAASRTDGTVSVCQGRWATAANESRRRRTSLESGFMVTPVYHSDDFVGQPIQAADPLSSGSRRLKAGLQPGMAAPQASTQNWNLATIWPWRGLAKSDPVLIQPKPAVALPWAFTVCVAAALVEVGLFISVRLNTL